MLITESDLLVTFKLRYSWRLDRNSKLTDRKSPNVNTPILKFADDTLFTGLITDDGDSHCRQQIGDVVD